jgi:hypothetical protein
LNILFLEAAETRCASPGKHEVSSGIFLGEETPLARKSAALLDSEIDQALRVPPGEPRAGRSRRGTGTTVAARAKKANEALHDLVHGTYFTAIPLDRIFDAVEQAGLRFDPEEQQCILCGREGRATWHLFDDAGRGVDRMLVLSWHKLDVTGRYEVVLYVS